MTTTMTRPAATLPPPQPPLPPKRNSSAVKTVKRILPSGLQLIILAVLVLLPVGFVLLAAFTTTSPGPGSLGDASFTFSNFKVLLTSSALSAMLNSTLVGLGASIVALFIGSGMAFLAARTNVPGRKLIYFFGIAPLFLPALVGALAWAQLGSPASGYINVVARAVGIDELVNIYSFGGLIFVLGIYYAPYTFLMVHSALSLMNPDLEDAASLHGAPLSKMLRTITFPLVMPAIVGSGILVFALTVENFPVAQVIGVPGQVDTLPTLIYRLMNASPSRQNAAAAIAVVLTILLMIAVAVQQRTVAKKQYTTVSGKGVRARQVPLRTWRWPAAIAAWVYFGLAVVLPITALLITALQTSPYLSELSQLFESGALSFWSMGQTLQDLGILECPEEQRDRRRGSSPRRHGALFRFVVHPVSHQRLGSQSAGVHRDDAPGDPRDRAGPRPAVDLADPARPGLRHPRRADHRLHCRVHPAGLPGGVLVHRSAGQGP